ncbi:M48 family metallopeptidase [Colwelliaceae bacterium BS250]
MQPPQYQLVRSAKRRTISLQVKASKVRVLAPAHIPESAISQFVQQKSTWLWKKISEQQSVTDNKQRSFETGDIFYYLGQPLTLIIKYAAQQYVDIDNEATSSKYSIHINNLQQLVITFNSEPITLAKQTFLVKSILHDWLLQQAQIYLANRISQLQIMTGLQISALKIRHYKTRWGSCDAKQRINLNWLLIMAPKDVIDYVIIHELCHLRHLNHSAQFWLLVKSFYSDIAGAKHWLKQHQSHLYW